MGKNPDWSGSSTERGGGRPEETGVLTEGKNPDWFDSKRGEGWGVVTMTSCERLLLQQDPILIANDKWPMCILHTVLFISTFRSPSYRLSKKQFVLNLINILYTYTVLLIDYTS